METQQRMNKRQKRKPTSPERRGPRKKTKEDRRGTE